MGLTPVGKAFLALIIIAVVGFVAYKRYRGNLEQWAGQGEAGKVEPVTRDDFNRIGNSPDAPRDGKVDVNAGNATVGGGKLNRPLRVAINTWAGHAPGLVANGGLHPGSAASSAASIYKKK